MEYNIGQIWNEVWGVVPAFNVPGHPSIHDVLTFGGADGYKVNRLKEKGSNAFYPDSELQKSPFNTDVLFSFEIGGQGLKYFDPFSGALEIDYPDWFRVPVATLIDFSREKENIKTRVNGGIGTVKELFSMGDWKLKIRGLVFDEYGANITDGGRTAVELRRQLLRFENFADSIPVRGWLFNEMKITHITINRINLQQVAGKPWVIPFDMDCDSDASPELIIQKGSPIKRIL